MLAAHEGGFDSLDGHSMRLKGVGVSPWILVSQQLMDGGDWTLKRIMKTIIGGCRSSSLPSMRRPSPGPSFSHCSSPAPRLFCPLTFKRFLLCDLLPSLFILLKAFSWLGMAWRLSSHPHLNEEEELSLLYPINCQGWPVPPGTSSSWRTRPSSSEGWSLFKEESLSAIPSGY